MTFEQIIPLITCIFLFIAVFAMHTKNFASALIFKIIPFFIALGNLIIVANGFGWIKI